MTEDTELPQASWRTKWRWKRIAAIIATVIALPTLAFGLYYWLVDIPSPKEMRAGKVTTIYASDNTTVLSKIVPKNSSRNVVTLNQVPKQLQEAVLSAEDRGFYSNPGFSVTGFARAARDNLVGSDMAGGGSTITQQYARNAFLNNERTLMRKSRELVIATKMDRQWTKDEILSAYLNTIYFGRGAYGIADAAEAYFGKSVEQLTLSEDAILASVIRAPSTLSQQRNHTALIDRWNYVLDGMVSMKALTPAQRVGVQFPTLAPVHMPPDAETGLGPEGLVRAQVLKELASEHLPDTAIGGLRIVTTIDMKAQTAAINAVNSVMRNQPRQLRQAVVSIDPRSGAVRAYYGGADGVGFDYAQAPLQTGSTFKVFGLIAALENGMSTSTPISSAPVKDGTLTVTNVGGESCGTCSLAQALKMSLNTSYFRLTQRIGAPAVAAAAHQAGIPKEIPGVPGPSLTDNGAPPGPSIVLGTYLVRAIDMASAYATVAAGGRYHQPYFIQKVTTATDDGKNATLLDRGAPDPGEQRVPTFVANQVTSAMLPIAAYSNGHALAGGRPSASKTGTTQLGNTGQNKDAWMIGFTPGLSTAVWVGADQAQAIRSAGGGMIYGAGLPADIWSRTMNATLARTPVERFTGAAPSTIIGGPPSGPIIGTSPRPTTDGGHLLNPPPPPPSAPAPVPPPPPPGLILPGPPPPPPPAPDPLIRPGPAPQGPLIAPGPIVPGPQGPIISPGPAR